MDLQTLTFIIVGKEISSCSYPIDLKIGRDLKNGTVFLNVQHGKEVDIEVTGRHDPCVVPRAVPIVEAMSAIVIADFYLLNRLSKI